LALDAPRPCSPLSIANAPSLIRNATAAGSSARATLARLSAIISAQIAIAMVPGRFTISSNRCFPQEIIRQKRRRLHALDSPLDAAAVVTRPAHLLAFNSTLAVIFFSIVIKRHRESY
jgi:hypothetical protein